MNKSTNLDVFFNKVSLTRQSNQGINVKSSEHICSTNRQAGLDTMLGNVASAFKNDGSAIENYNKGLVQLQEKGYSVKPSEVNYLYNGKNVGYKKYTNLPDGTKIIEKKLGNVEGAISKNPKTNKWSLTSFKMPELIIKDGQIEHISGSVRFAIEHRVPKRYQKQLNEIVDNFAKSLLKMK